MRYMLSTMVRVYRYLISPWLGQNCRFYPSCSCYTQQALIQHGSVKGSWIGLKRILRCHPWNEGGFDPVPSISSNSNVKHSISTSGNGSHG